MTEAELNAAKANVQSIIMDGYFKLRKGLCALDETPIKSYNYYKRKIEDEVLNDLKELSKKIQDELTW